MLACVTSSSPHGDAGDEDGSSSSGRAVNSKVVVMDVDLSSFVPSWFWTSQQAYSVVAAGDGLLCICNNEQGKDAVQHYCVVNPLTRTCTVLPPLPSSARWGWGSGSSSSRWRWGPGPGSRWRWLPLTATAVTIDNSVLNNASSHWDLHVATCDLTGAGAGAGGWVLAARVSTHHVPSMYDLDLAMCAGETYCYGCRCLRVHVHAPAVASASASGGVLAMVEAGAVKLPRPGSPLLDSGSDDTTGLRYNNHEYDHLVVAHRGAVFLVANLRFGRRPAIAVSDVWRLARDRMAWEPVARLDLRGVGRLTSCTGGAAPLRSRVCRAYAARELLCCHLDVITRDYRADVVVGLDLDTGAWELIHHGRAEEWRQWRSGAGNNPDWALVVELRPDVRLRQLPLALLDSASSSQMDDEWMYE